MTSDRSQQRRSIPAFGPNLRGLRLGWHWSAKHQAFIRMSEVKENILVELAPHDGIPSKKTPSGHHRCWWDGGTAILNELSWLRNVRRIKTYVSVLVDNTGEIIHEAGN